MHVLIILRFFNTSHARIQKGDWGPGPPYQNIGFLSNTSLDPLKITKLPSQHSMLVYHRHASERPFRWRADDGPHIVKFGSSLHSSTKKGFQIGPPLTKLSGSAHASLLHGYSMFLLFCSRTIQFYPYCYKHASYILSQLSK